jgi:PAS domain-containing protein
MTIEDLQNLSGAELVELIERLRAADDQLRGSADDIARLSDEVRESLEPAVDGQVDPLLTLTRYLADEHSEDELAELVRAQSARLFGVDDAVIFIAEQGSLLRPLLLPDGLQADPTAIEYAAIAAREAFIAQATITRPVGEGAPAIVALPLVRHNQGLGALALLDRTGDHAAVTAENGSWLTIVAGILAVVYDSKRRVDQLRHETHLLQMLVAQRTRQLQTSRDILRVVFDHLPDGVLLLDETEHITAANQTFCDTIAGRHPRDVVGQRYSTIWGWLKERGALQVAEAPGDASQRIVDCATATETNARYAVTRRLVPVEEDQPPQLLEFWEPLRGL